MHHEWVISYGWYQEEMEFLSLSLWW